MDGLSWSAWLVLILGFVICFGGAFWCVLIMTGKEPGRILNWIGISRILSHPLKATADDVMYRPFEYMDQGSKEKGIVVAVILFLLIIGWRRGIFEAESEGGYSDVDYDIQLYDDALDPIDGQSDEDSEQTVYPEVTETAITKIWFNLTWQDEPDQAGRENDGDEFQLEVTTPWGETNETPMVRNEDGEEGVLTLNFSAPEAGDYPDSGSAGSYNVTITMGEAGDQWDIILGVVGSNDGGNDWTLTTEYQYYRKPL